MDNFQGFYRGFNFFEAAISSSLAFLGCLLRGMTFRHPLVFDERTDRYDIRFDLNSYYGGLHCGDCMEVFVRGKWKPTRMEYGDNWYLVGIRAEDLNGLRVRI